MPGGAEEREGGGAGAGGGVGEQVAKEVEEEERRAFACQLVGGRGIRQNSLSGPLLNLFSGYPGRTGGQQTHYFPQTSLNAPLELLYIFFSFLRGNACWLTRKMLYPNTKA